MRRLAPSMEMRGLVHPPASISRGSGPAMDALVSHALLASVAPWLRGSVVESDQRNASVRGTQRHGRSLPSLCKTRQGFTTENTGSTETCTASRCH